MFSKRLSKLNTILKFPGYLVTNQADLFYLTGIDLEGFWLLATKENTTIFTSKLLAGQIKDILPGTKIVSGGSFAGMIIDFCKKNKIKVIGLDPEKVSCALAVRLGSKIKIEYSRGLVAKIREIKDILEIDLIRKSCAIAKETVDYAEKLLHPGISEEKIAFKIYEYFAKRGVKASFPVIVASGPNSANPHHLSSTRKIEREDTVLIDLGCTYKGYCSDLTRTFFLGSIKRLKKQIYSLVEQAQNSALKEVSTGKKTCEVDKAARNTIVKGGYGNEFIHSTGHGVGLEIHELPRLSSKDKTILKPGMVVTVEPGIYLPSRFGVRIEDTVLVTEKGKEVLTK